MSVVHVSYEAKRLCGYRKAGKEGYGLYLVGTGNFERCERLPFPLETCPCCGGGIKFSRGFTWINPMALFDPYRAAPLCFESHGIEKLPTFMQEMARQHRHDQCWMCNPELVGSQAGLLWAGEQAYPTASHFAEEARRMGISRRIAHLPHGFRIGEDVIFMAHNKVLRALHPEDGTFAWKAAVFMSFRPALLEIVIDDPEEIPAAVMTLVNRVGDDYAKIIKVVPLDKETEDVEEY